MTLHMNVTLYSGSLMTTDYKRVSGLLSALAWVTIKKKEDPHKFFLFTISQWRYDRFYYWRHTYGAFMEYYTWNNISDLVCDEDLSR